MLTLYLGTIVIILIFLVLLITYIALNRACRWSQGVFSSGMCPPIAQSEEMDCSICLGRVELGVETNCRHIFCGMCLMEYNDRLTTISTPKCPYCRQRITLVLLNFNPEETTNNLSASMFHLREEIIHKVNLYNRTYSRTGRNFLEHLKDLPLLLRRLRRILVTNRTQNYFRTQVFMVQFSSLLYFLIPFDFIPEINYGLLGYVDDFILIIFSAIYVANLYRNLITRQGYPL
uniref:E3 ubiquitin-protein ligase RNF170 n=1 Tax=Lepeophtheirus salmonis TaxID=72036 RepID=A0A0K2SXH8_LEPSM|nr:E3 ubiquitin-protein ligase RNF170-like [Lepeophtheirus salmonis]